MQLALTRYVNAPTLSRTVLLHNNYAVLKVEVCSRGAQFEVPKALRTRRRRVGEGGEIHSHPTRDLGNAVSSLRGVWSGAPAEIEFWRIFALKSNLWWQQF